MRGDAPISRIYRMGEPRSTDLEKQERLDRYRAHLWHNAGLVVLRPDEVSNEWVRQALINEAEKAYGRRG